MTTFNSLQEGDIAPDFKGIDQKGNEISLATFLGKKVILYFYPKDNTPGCTAQACNLRDNYNFLINKGFVVIGVSADSQKSHQKFAESQNLPFPLLVDEDKLVIKAYGVWGEKSLYGKKYEGIHRKTFLIDENGKIEKIFHKAETKTHTDQIIKSLNK